MYCRLNIRLYIAERKTEVVVRFAAGGTEASEGNGSDGHTSPELDEGRTG